MNTPRLTEQQAHEMGAKGAPATDDERLLFEAWMRGHCWALCATWDGKSYRSDTEHSGYADPRAANTRQLWAAWRDRAALAAQAAPAVPAMSAEEVNALPERVRAYIHQLVANTDPAGMVRENMQLRDTNQALQMMYRKAADAAQEAVGCVHAANIEGLQEALSETSDERLKDLVERRLMYALYAVQEVAPAAPAVPAAGVPCDTSRGDTACLVSNINALLELDAKGALVPHGIGGHARSLLSAAASRLTAAAAGVTAGAAPDTDAAMDAFEKKERGKLAAHIAAELVAEVRAMLAAAPQPPAEAQEPVDSMGIPLSCGKPLCSPGDHHPLCKLYAQPAEVDALEQSHAPLREEDDDPASPAHAAIAAARARLGIKP